jgi:hypothetical protein
VKVDPKAETMVLAPTYHAGGPSEPLPWREARRGPSGRRGEVAEWLVSYRTERAIRRLRRKGLGGIAALAGASGSDHDTRRLARLAQLMEKKG